MKKLLAVLSASLMAFLALFGVAGCAPKSKEGQITFYAWGNQTEIGYYNDMIDGFEELNPGITVKLERATGSDPVNDLKTRFSSGSEPDVFFMDPGEIGAFVKEGHIEPLNSYMQGSTVLSEEDLWSFNDYYRFDENGTLSKEGQLYGFIKDLSPDFIMIYNKDMIDEYNESGAGDHIDYPSETIPMTWNEYMRLAQKMTKVNSNGVYTRYGTLVDYVPVKHLMQMIQQTGSSIFSEDMKSLNIKANGDIDTGLMEAMQYYYDLQVSYDGHIAPAKFVNSSLISSADLFREGQVFSIWYGKWAFPAYKLDVDSMNIGVAPCPVPERKNNDETDNYGITSGMIGYAMSSRCTKKEEAYKFIEYAMTKGAEYMAEIGHNVPGNKNVAQSIFCNVSDSKMKRINQFYYNYLDKHTYSIDISPYIQSTKLDSIVFMEITKAVEGVQSLETAIREANKKIKTETGA